MKPEQARSHTEGSELSPFTAFINVYEPPRSLSKIATPKRNLSTVLAPSRKASIFVLSSDASKVPLLPPPALPPIHLSQTAMERATRGTNPSAVSFAGPDNTLPSVVARMEVPKSKEIISDAWAARIKERQYDINLVTKSMDVYEPLLDDYLWDYFQNPNTRKHLMKLGLIKPDGEIIDFKEFKYAQIRLQKEEKERQVRKNQEERDLDREIEVAIRNKIRRDKVMFHEKYQNMGRPGSQKAFPEFLADYPINMWRTVLLYAQKPPSLTHVGNLPRRSTKSAPHDKKREPQGESAMIPKIFKSAKEKFEAGDLEAVKMLLCDIINQLRSSGSVRDIQEDLDHYSISQAIQDAIDQAGITLMGCERLLIGYIHKLGGNVEKVIEHLKKGRFETAVQTKASNDEPLPPVRLSRPHSARPTRDSPFPETSEFSTTLSNAENIQLSRPNSAGLHRSAEFKKGSLGSQFSLTGATSVHFERPPSARPNRNDSLAARTGSSFSSDFGDVDVSHDIDDFLASTQASGSVLPATSNFHAAEDTLSDQKEVANTVEGEAYEIPQACAEAPEYNPTDELDLRYENESVESFLKSETAEQNSGELQRSLSKENGERDLMTHDRMEKGDVEDPTGHESQTGKDLATKSSIADFIEAEMEPLDLNYEDDGKEKAETVIETDQAPTTADVDSQNANLDGDTIDSMDPMKTHFETQEVQDFDWGGPLLADQKNEDGAQQGESQVDQSADDAEVLQNQDAIELGSTFLTKDDVNSILRSCDESFMIKQKDPKNESMESFMITEGVTGNKHGSEDEIRSNSRICTPNDSRPSLALFGLDSPDVTKYSQSGLAHPDQFKDTNNYMPYEKSPLSVAHPAESLKGSSSSLSKVPSKSAMKKTASSSRALNGYESASMINEMPFQDEATRDLALEELAIKPTNNEHIIDGSEHDLKQPEIKSKEVVNLPLQSRGNVNLSSSSLKTRPARSATTPTESQKSITSATRHSETSLQTSLTNLNQKAAEGNRESTHASGEDRMQSQPDLNAYSARNHSHTSAFSTDAILDATKIAASPPKSPERIASQVSVRMSRQSLNQCIADDANGLSHPVEVKRISSKRNSVKFEKNDRDRESNTVASSSPQFVPLRDSTPSLQQSRHHSLNGLGATEVVGHGNADEGLSQHTLIQEDEVHFQSDFIATEPSSPKASRPQSASTTRTKHSLTESQQVPNGPLEGESIETRQDSQTREDTVETPRQDSTSAKQASVKPPRIQSTSLRNSVTGIPSLEYAGNGNTSRHQSATLTSNTEIVTNGHEEPVTPLSHQHAAAEPNHSSHSDIKTVSAESLTDVRRVLEPHPPIHASQPVVATEPSAGKRQASIAHKSASMNLLPHPPPSLDLRHKSAPFLQEAKVETVTSHKLRQPSKSALKKTDNTSAASQAASLQNSGENIVRGESLQILKAEELQSASNSAPNMVDGLK